MRFGPSRLARESETLTLSVYRGLPEGESSSLRGNAAPSGSAWMSSRTLDHLDREALLLDPARKQEYVNAIFDTVAGSYDRFTRLCSFGMDAVWKRELVR